MHPTLVMTPGARIAAAIQVLDAWMEGGERLDRILTRWGRANRYAGSGDRRAVADLCYGALRRRRSALWAAGVDGPGSARDLLRGALMLDGLAPEAFFTGQGHAPVGLDGHERAAARALADAPRAVRLDIPDWLLPDLADTDDAVLAAMRDRAPVHLRVNTLRAALQDVRDSLKQDGIETEAIGIAATALKVTEGARRIGQSQAMCDGWIEIQDAASQAAAAFAEARPGETVLDLCAGAGGKTLALAAAMQGCGRLCVHDVAPERMADLPGRAARAGVRVETVPTEALGGLRGGCDLVFVDAPCSGSGTWRREPEAKWRLDRARIETLVAVQAELLDQAAALVRPGGRICYATCSLLSCENDAQVARFCGPGSGWQVARARHLDPTQGCDGFFVALLTGVGTINQS